MLKQINLHEVVNGLQSKSFKYDTIVKNNSAYSTNGNILVISNSLTLPDGYYKVIDNEFFVINETTPDPYSFLPGELIEKFEIDSNFIDNIILMSSFAINDGSERPALCGVFYDAKNKKLVATDTHVLRLKDFDLAINNSFIIPAGYSKFFKKLKRLCEGGKKYFCELYNASENRENQIFKIYFENYEIYFYLINDMFPNWTAVIPNEFNATLEFNRKELIGTLESLKRIDKRIEFEKVNDKFYILRSETDREGFKLKKSSNLELINFQLLTDKRLEKEFYELCNDFCLLMPMRSEKEFPNFSINADYLLTVAKSFDKETINLNFIDSRHAILIF